MRLINLTKIVSLCYLLSPANAFSSTGTRVIPSPAHVLGKHLSLTPPIKAPIPLGMSSKPTGTDSDCPVERAGSRVTKGLAGLDKYVLKRVIRIANHGPALLSLSYFFLISMASMMGMGPLTPTAGTAGAATKVTLAAALTQAVGMTTNAQFATLFPTLITPASFVFLVWPIVSVLQLITVITSAIYPSDDEFLSQNELSSLTVANLFSGFWLLVSSNAKAGLLPLSSFTILPLVPIFSGYPLRNSPTYLLPAFQLFSSFTTLASFLAFTVELQHGGRIPYFGKLSAEVSGSVFLLLYSAASLAVKNKSVVKRIINCVALTGIIVRRIAAVTTGSLWSGILGLVSSVTFLGTVGCWVWSAKELFFPSKKE